MSLADAQERVVPAQPIQRLRCFVVDLGSFLVMLGIGWIDWPAVEARAARTPGG